MARARDGAALTARSAFVTGGTGFVGAAVVRALVAEGTAVRALARPGSSRENLAGLPVEIVEGGLEDGAALRRGARGCDEVYHCAALYAFWAKDRRAFHETNVAGTARVLRAGAEAGAARLVHTSSVATVKPLPGRAADESSVARAEEAPGDYKRSKILAEAEALRLASEEGAPVVVVNPSAPVGRGDVKPTPTGQMIVDFLEGRMPAFVDTGLNVVDVDDVGASHVLAARRGVPGERYILGGENLTLEEILGALAAATGLPAPRIRLPHGVALAVALACEAGALLTRRAPRVALESVRLARHRMHFDDSRARRELGHAPRPAREALAGAAAWLLASGRARPSRPVRLAPRPPAGP